MTDTVIGQKLNNHLQCVPASAVLPGGAAAAQPMRQLSPAEPSFPQVPSQLKLVAGKAMLECSSCDSLADSETAVTLVSNNV